MRAREIIQELVDELEGLGKLESVEDAKKYLSHDDDESLAKGKFLAGKVDGDLEVFMAHDPNRAEENPFSYIAAFSIAVDTKVRDPQGQPYLYNYHWTAEQAGYSKEEWERMKGENQVIVIGWGGGDYEQSRDLLNKVEKNLTNIPKVV